MRVILITGAAGFIGSHFTRYILNHFPLVKVVGFDKLTYAGSMDNLADCVTNPNFTFVRGDIADPVAIKSVLTEHQITEIVNFAAETHVDRSIAGPAEFIHTNVNGTQILLDLAMRHNIQKFVHMSTDEVYGDLPYEADFGYRFTEFSPLNPSSPYSASKASADLLILAWKRTYKFPVSIVRSSNVFGSHQHREKLIPTLISSLCQNVPFKLYGDGRNMRDWVWVGDVCVAIDRVLHQGTPGEIYNIGGIQVLSNITVANGIGHMYCAKFRPDFNEIWPITFIEDRPGHDRMYAMNWNKINSHLGWEPTKTLWEEIPNLINWYAKNPAR